MFRKINILKFLALVVVFVLIFLPFSNTAYAAVLPTLIPGDGATPNAGDADTATSNLLDNEGGTACNSVECNDSIDETIASTDDGTTFLANINTNTNTRVQGFELTDMPSDFSDMDTLTIDVRVQKSGTRDNDNITLQARVFEGGGVTALTNLITICTWNGTTDDCGTSWNTITKTFTLEGNDTKTVWDNAELHLTWDTTKSQAGDGTEVQVSTAELDGTYNAAAGADLSWDTGAADFEIWAGATANDDAVLTWDNGTLVCSTSLTDDNTRTSACGLINPSQTYRVQTVLENVGGTAADMASGDFVDQVNVQTYWAGTSATLVDCGFDELGASDDGATSCSVAYNSTNNVRLTNGGAGSVVIAATTGTEGFMYRITTDDDVSLSNASTYWNASIDSVTEDSSKISIGQKRAPGIFVRGLVKIRGLVKFR